MGDRARDASGQQPWLQGPMWPWGARCGQAPRTGQVGGTRVGGWRCCRQVGRGALVLPTAAPCTPLITAPQASRRPHSVCPWSEQARPPLCIKLRVMPRKFPGGPAASCGRTAARRLQGARRHPGPHGGWCQADCAPGMGGGGNTQHTHPAPRWRHGGPQTWVQGWVLSHGHCLNISPFKRTDLANTLNTNRDEMPPGTRSSFIFQAQECHAELGHEVTPRKGPGSPVSGTHIAGPQVVSSQKVTKHLCQPPYLPKQ